MAGTETGTSTSTSGSRSSSRPGSDTDTDTGMQSNGNVNVHVHGTALPVIWPFGSSRLAFTSIMHRIFPGNYSYDITHEFDTCISLYLFIHT